MTSYFPDVNLWVALNHDQHAHHSIANQWYLAQPESCLFIFCRQTQLGLFRVLSTPAIMGNEALTLQACWQIFDRWAGTGQVRWASESAESHELERRLRARTAANSVSPGLWMDAYLATFAETAGLTLVTFDKALAGKAKGAVLLA
ncbi:MAG TPA: TA system VapC family ribonuclease toxin [Terracidiphilus sp.]|nr:TA system VapC family ribonuclease toxin [Terracidiphilus sp.]